MQRQQVQHHNALLWSGILAAPIAFLLNLEINYSLEPWACVTGKVFVLHIASIATLILAAAGCITAWKSWRNTGGHWPETAPAGVARDSFMAVWGVLMSVMFFLVIIAQAIPTFIQGPCPR